MKIQHFLERLLPCLSVLTVTTIPAAIADELCQVKLPISATSATFEPDPLHAIPHSVRAPHVGKHGQLLIGEEILYMLHLPVFMRERDSHPHNFQIIAEVEFTDIDDLRLYRQERARSESSLFTAVPPVFDNASMVHPQGGRRPINSLPGVSIVRGHFEQGGQTIIDAANLDIVRLIEFQEFSAVADTSPVQSYRLYGMREDMFMTHLLSAPPDYDQTMKVGLVFDENLPETVAKELELRMRSGMIVELSDRKNSVEARVRANETIHCDVHLDPESPPLEASLEIQEEMYCEQGELSAVVIDSFHQPERCD